jgi:AcrR family transcriptional regulator
VDPRVSRSRASVMRAAADLFVEGGPSAVTIDAIVLRSGVAKSTIYRHWGSRDDVLVEVIESCAPELPVPDPGVDVETALRDTVKAVGGFLSDPQWARMLPALLMLKHHEAGIADLEQRIEREQDKVLTTILERAVAEGLLPKGVDVQEAITFLLGPMLFAHLTDAAKVDDDFADRSVDRFLAAYRSA